MNMDTTTQDLHSDNLSNTEVEDILHCYTRRAAGETLQVWLHRTLDITFPCIQRTMFEAVKKDWISQEAYDGFVDRHSNHVRLLESWEDGTWFLCDNCNGGITTPAPGIHSVVCESCGCIMVRKGS